METKKRYILMPASNEQSTDGGNPNVTDFLISLSTHAGAAPSAAAVKLSIRNAPKAKAASINIKVVDSINEDGAKLVEMDEAEMANFHFSYPGLRIVPEKFYSKPPLPNKEVLIKTKKAQVSITSQITLTDGAGKPVPNATVVVFTNFTNRVGASGTTNASGIVKVSLNASKIERMYVYPQHSYWGFYKASFTIQPTMAISLVPIDVSFKDVLRNFYPTKNWPVIAAPLKVGVIDSGVGPHPDLIVAGGANTIDGENENDYGYNGDGEGHGTHVGGIIAANGNIKGVAAGVQLYSYRIFPKVGSTTNFIIMKAIRRAVDDGCLLLNMSFGGGSFDESIVSSIKYAYSKGVICFVANGNDDRSPVSFPASYSLCVAVSAMGRKGTYPDNTVEKAGVKAPFGNDADNYIADFSNIGPETDITAPGVGIISTFPSTGIGLYTIMDGTSMATPAATGMAARLIASQPNLLGMPAIQQRADEILKFLSTKIKAMGFGTNFEGKGMLFP